MSTSVSQYLQIFNEAGIPVDRASFIAMSEAAKAQVTDEQLTGMMKFIVDKYNSIDFSEIEKSAGDISRFKYYQMLQENLNMLDNIYRNSPDPGAKKYSEVIDACRNVLNHLNEHRRDYMTLYKLGDGITQLLYTSLLAAELYVVGVLVSNTIRFVTTEQDTDCQVLYDEIPGTIKHVYIKNILDCNKSLGDISKYLTTAFNDKSRSKVMHESISIGSFALGSGVTTAAGVVLGVAAVIYLIPKLIHLIREIVYSVYFSRVRVSEMLDLQVKLIRTNIESLEAGRGTKKVIARQKKIANTLEAWKNKIAIKNDTVENIMNVQKNKENSTLAIDKSTADSFEISSNASGDLLL